MAKSYGVSTATIGIVVITGIRRVRVNEDAQPIFDASDAAPNATPVGFTARSVGIEVEMSDQVMAQTLRDAASGDFSFNGLNIDGGTAVTVTATAAKFFAVSPTNSRNEAGVSTVRGIAASVAVT